MLEALTKSIEVPNRVLLALTPHERPLLLTRSWCLYEIYTAWKVGAEVFCGFVPKAEQKFIRSLASDDGLVDEILSTVDAEKSQATWEPDRRMILSLIQKAGVQSFNQFVQEKLSASLRLVALNTVPKADSGMLENELTGPTEKPSSSSDEVYLRYTEKLDLDGDGMQEHIFSM